MDSPQDSTLDQAVLAAPVAAVTETFEEPWFNAPPPSSQATSSRPPPVVHVGEFLGDPEVDGWLR